MSDDGGDASLPMPREDRLQAFIASTSLETLKLDMVMTIEQTWPVHVD